MKNVVQLKERYDELINAMDMVGFTDQVRVGSWSPAPFPLLPLLVTSAPHPQPPCLSRSLSPLLPPPSYLPSPSPPPPLPLHVTSYPPAPPPPCHLPLPVTSSLPVLPFTSPFLSPPLPLPHPIPILLPVTSLPVTFTSSPLTSPSSLAVPLPSSQQEEETECSDAHRLYRSVYVPLYQPNRNICII